LKLGALVAILMATDEPSDNSVVTEGSDDSVVAEEDTVVAEVDTVVTKVDPVVTEVGRVVVAVDPVATDEDADPNGDITIVGLQPRINHFVDHLFGVLGGDFMLCWGIATFLPDRERLQIGFRFCFQFPIGLRFRVGALAPNSDQIPAPLDVSGSGLAPQPPPAKAARGSGDSSPR
jgi:hypothetical protein